MKTFLVTIDETESTIDPEMALRSVKGVVSVGIQSLNFLSEEEWVRPGREASDEELENRLSKALASGDPISLEQSIKQSKHK